MAGIVMILSGCASTAPHRARIVKEMNVDCGSPLLDVPHVAPLRSAYDPEISPTMLTSLRNSIEMGMTWTNAVDKLLGLGFDLELYSWTSDFGEAGKKPPRYAVAIHRIDHYTELVFRFEQSVHEANMVLFSAYIRRADGKHVWLEGPLLTKGVRRSRYETVSPDDIPRDPLGEHMIDEKKAARPNDGGGVKPKSQHEIRILK